jgi:hypothetical protein
LRRASRPSGSRRARQTVAGRSSRGAGGTGQRIRSRQRLFDHHHVDLAGHVYVNSVHSTLTARIVIVVGDVDVDVVGDRDVFEKTLT